MLRRASRAILLVVGVFLLLWGPMSRYVGLWFTAPFLSDEVSVSASQGLLSVVLLSGSQPFEARSEMGIRRETRVVPNLALRGNEPPFVVEPLAPIRAPRTRGSGLLGDARYIYDANKLAPTWRTHTISSQYSFSVIYVPLWLPALLCLAWPVTSFLLARRKRRRGFEAVGVELAPETPLPPGEVPRPQAEAERAEFR